MHRFFVTPEVLTTAPLVMLTGEHAHQIVRVLRLRAGERIALFDGSGDEWEVRLLEVAPRGVTGEIEQRRSGHGEPRLHLTLFQAPLKGDHMDYVLQKGTELGVAAFTPLLTERTVARAIDDRKLTRWRRIIREAAEQSGRSLVPALHPPVALAALDRSQAALSLVLWEAEQSHGLGDALRALPRPLPPLTLVIGPEGGLTGAEVSHLRASGATPVTLGPRILRAETAGIAAAAAILYAAGDLGSPPA